MTSTATQCEKTDPVTFFTNENEDCLKHIFHFVQPWRQGSVTDEVHGRVTKRARKETTLEDSDDEYVHGVDFCKVMAFQGQLSCVSPKWKLFFENNIAQMAPYLNVDTCAFIPGWGKSQEWLYKYNFSLKSLDTGIGRHQYPSRLLQECDTSQLTHYGELVLEIPMEDGVFQDKLALYCPQLTSLKTSLYCYDQRNDIEQLLRPSLFSNSNITELSMGVVADGVLDRSIFSNIIKNLPSLQTLELKGGRIRPSPNGDGHPSFHVQSNSLRFLKVSGLTGAMLWSLDCPQLVKFYCLAQTTVMRGASAWRSHHRVIRGARVQEACDAVLVDGMNSNNQCVTPFQTLVI